MREIKFRAWDKKNNFMITQDDKQLKSLDLASGYIYVGHYKGENDRFIRFTEIELMQFTGARDTNCREIYEGEIVVFNDNRYGATGGRHSDKIRAGVVKFDEGSWIVESGDYSEYLYQIIANDDEVEVIGNVFENKELLEESA